MTDRKLPPGKYVMEEHPPVSKTIEEARKHKTNWGEPTPEELATTPPPR
jgi:hypothetical protein